MINYIIQVILFQVLFLAIYDLFLSKETFFTKNRWYLLSTSILSFLLPFFKISMLQEAVSQEFIIYLPEMFLSPEKVIQQAAWYQSADYVNILFLGGVAFFSILFLLKLFKIFNLIRKHQIIKKDNYTLVLISNTTKAFSFFNYIFIGDEIPVSQREKIIAHEFVHSVQKHSLDLLFFEILKIVMWFNPMIILYQKRITIIHEYISDEIASKKNQKEHYINNLLSNFFQVENISFINQFYKQSFIKKRIIMMTKKQSKKMNQLKYLLLIPVLASMLFYTSCASSSSVEKSEINVLKEENVQLRDSLKDVKIKLQNASELNNYLPENEIEERLSDGSVSFMKIDKAPTFPGCETGDKKCFSKMVQMNFAKKFDSNLPNNLGLKTGKKRVFVGFKIDKEGQVVEIQARAPHPKLKAEVVRVMNTLPKMIPGEQNGEKVAVKYSIPFTLFVD
jgi:hypothetical protein